MLQYNLPISESENNKGGKMKKRLWLLVSLFLVLAIVAILVLPTIIHPADNTQADISIAVLTVPIVEVGERFIGYFDSAGKQQLFEVIFGLILVTSGFTALAMLIYKTLTSLPANGRRHLHSNPRGNRTVISDQLKFPFVLA